MTRNSESTNAGCGCLLLLMCVVAVGAIALPSFMNSHPDRSTFSEAKQYISSLNRGQQAHFLEKGAFSTSVEGVGIGIKTETTNFKYSVSATKQAAFNYGVSKNEKYKSYVGGVFVIRVKPNNAEDAIRTQSILCVTNEPSTTTPQTPKIENGKLVCGTGTTSVTK